MALITAQMRTDVTNLYISLFGRAPEADGLGYWVGQLGGGKTLAQVAQDMYNTTPARAYYPAFFTNQEIIAKFYVNVLGRTADTDGLNYWTGQLNNGLTPGAVIANMLTAVVAYNGTDAAALASKQLLANKTAVGLHYAVDLLGNDVAKAAAVLVGITSTMTTADAVAACDATLTPAPVAQTFTLTAGIDAVTGGAANDTINALDISGVNAWSGLDKIDGGAGTNDTFNIATAVNLVKPAGSTVANIETINVTQAGSTATVTLDTSSGFTGLTTLNVTQAGTGADTLTSATTTNVNVTSAGAVTVTGGKSVVISTTGAATVSGEAGSATVTAAGTVAVDNGTDVTVTNSGGTTTVGATTAASGNVTVTNTGTGNTVTVGGASVLAKGSVTVSSGDAVTVYGGTTQTVTASKGAVTLSGATGAVSVVDSVQGTGTISIDGGTSVSVTATSAGTGAITIGNTTQPTGAISVTQNESTAAIASGSTVTSGLVTVKGGTSVTVTETATGAVNVAGTANGTIASGGVAVTGTTATTSVTITQPVAASAVTKAAAVAATAAVTESSVVTFADVANNASATVGTLTFTNKSGATLTAATVASLFANLANNTASSALTSASGTFTGYLTGWSSGAVVTDTSGNSTVTFTSATPATNVTDLSASVATATKVADGSAAVAATAAVAGNVAVTNGTDVVTDASWNSGTSSHGAVVSTITNVTAANYSTLTVNSDALTTLSASAGGNITVNNASTLGAAVKTTTLDLTLNGVSGTFADNNVYKTLNVHANTANSTLLNINDTALTQLNVDGSKVLTLTSASGATSLAKVAVSGAAGVTSTALSASTITDVNASATSGAMSVTIDATKATYEGGTGVDNVTLAAAITSVTGGTNKAITLGDGDDKLVLASNSGSAQFVTSIINGGAGTNTLSMTAADAAVTASNSFFATSFATGLTNFQVLNLTGANGETVNVGALGFGVAADTISVGATTGSLTVANFASGETLNIAGSNATHTITLTGAFTGTSDSAKITLGNASGGTVAATGVESVAITTNIASSSLTLDDVHAAVTVAGSGSLNLTLSNNVASVNASSSTGGLTITAAGDTGGTTVTGSASAANSLTATGTGTVTLIGGAAADQLTASAGSITLTGGAGADTFTVASAGASTSVFTTITDLSAGDTLVLKDQNAETWTAAKVAAASVDTLTFAAALNAAVGTTDNTTNGAIKWFQYQGNTYVVEGLADHTAATGSNGTFSAGTDIVVKLTGLVDLSHVAANGNSLLMG